MTTRYVLGRSRLFCSKIEFSRRHRRGGGCIRALSSSSSSKDESSSTATTVGSKKEPPTSSEESTKEDMIFPWRHEEAPIPRLVEGTKEQKEQGQLLLTVTKQNSGNSTMNALATAFMFLDVPIYQFLFFGSWKAELADSMSWAFTQGMAGLLSRWTLPPAPMNNFINDTYELSFHTEIGDQNNKAEDTATSPSDATEILVPLETIFEEKLIAFYRAAQENINRKTELCLKTVPYSAELVSLYAIPYISRDNIKTDPALASFYRDMMAQPSMDRTSDLNKLRKEKLEAGIMESTVIAQVLVWCNEVFYVKDVESGKVVQGDDGESSRNIPHLLRMESTVKTRKDASGNFQNIRGDWKITDIDDMLQGNLLL